MLRTSRRFSPSRVEACVLILFFGPLSFLKFLFRTVIEGAVAHSREELFSKAFPQETRKGHHFSVTASVTHK